MKKIKTFFDRISDEVKLVVNKFPVTGLSIIFDVFLWVFLWDKELPGAALSTEQRLFFMACFSAAAFCIESCQLKAIRKVFSLVIGGVISGVFTWLLYYIEEGSSALGLSDVVIKAKIPRFIALYFILLLVWGVYRNYLSSGKSFVEYATKTARNLAMLSIICGIMAAGIGFVCAIFITLILSGTNFSHTFSVTCIICVSFGGMGFLSSLSDSNKEISKFFTIVVKYVLLLPLIAAFVVIYIYIIKIIVTQIVPSNEIFRILSMLFASGVPIWTMSAYFSKDNVLQKIAVLLPYIYTPFLILQGYAIGTRIAAHGMTPMRYLCLMLMLFEIIYILIYWRKREKIGMMLPVLMVMAVIALLIPGINMFDVSRNDQQSQIALYSDKDFAELTHQQQSRLVGAYFYLKGDVDGAETVESIPEELKGSIEAIGQYAFDDEKDVLYVNRFFNMEDVDISGSTSMTQVHFYQEMWQKEAKEADVSRIELSDPDDNRIMAEIDISKLAEQYIREDRLGSSGAATLTPIKIETASGDSFVPAWIVFSIDESDEIKDLNIEGFLFK